jgi:diacylglycerol kinase family enzyme
MEGSSIATSVAVILLSGLLRLALACWRTRRSRCFTQELHQRLSAMSLGPRIFSRCLAIVNPISGAGRGDADWGAVSGALTSLGIECVTLRTERAGQVDELLRSVAIHTFDVLIVVGGDGLLHEVINALPSTDAIPIAVLPSGTGNGVATSVGIRSPIDLAVAIAGHQCARPLRSQSSQGSQQTSSAVRKLDLMLVSFSGDTSRPVECVLSCLSVGWGAIADHDYLAEGQLRWAGALRELLVPLWIILRKSSYRGVVSFKPSPGEPLPTRAHQLRGDGWVSLRDDFCLVHCCNLAWISHDAQCAPGARVDDGRIGVLIMRRATRLQLISMFLNAESGGHVRHEAVELYWASEVTLEPEPEPIGSIAVDGEAAGYPKCTHMSSWPSAASVVTAL